MMKLHQDEQYLAHGEDILGNGVFKEDRTGVGCFSVFGREMRFDISGGKIPLLTTKKVFVKSITHELIWFLKGDTNIRYLKEHNVNIWDSWVKPETAEYRDLTIDEMKASIAKAEIANGEGLWESVDFVEHPTVESWWAGEAWIGSMKREIIYGGSDGLKDAYRVIVGEEPRKLIAGDLPFVYGKQWRAWEDIRFIDVDEIQTYVEKGYKWIGNLDTEPTEEGYESAYYGKMVYRREIDQIAKVIDQLRNNPGSRRILFTGWNVAYIDEMALPPCHMTCQFHSEVIPTMDLLKHVELYYAPYWNGYAADCTTQEEVFEALNTFVDTYKVPRRRLSAKLTQRSADWPLGVPFNIAQYSMLVHMVAQVTGHIPHEFIWSGGDCHIYSNQIVKFQEQLEREPIFYSDAKLRLNPNIKEIDDFKFEDFEVVDYVSHPAITFPAAAV